MMTATGLDEALETTLTDMTEEVVQEEDDTGHPHHDVGGPDLDLETEGDAAEVDLTADSDGGGQALSAPGDPANDQDLGHQASQEVGHHRVNRGVDLHQEMGSRTTNLHQGVLLTESNFILSSLLIYKLCILNFSYCIFLSSVCLNDLLF